MNLRDGSKSVSESNLCVKPMVKGVQEYECGGRDINDKMNAEYSTKMIVARSSLENVMVHASVERVEQAGDEKR